MSRMEESLFPKMIEHRLYEYWRIGTYESFGGSVRMIVSPSPFPSSSSLTRGKRQQCERLRDISSIMVEGKTPGSEARWNR